MLSTAIFNPWHVSELQERACGSSEGHRQKRPLDFLAILKVFKNS